MTRLLSAIAVAAALALPGCGADDESAPDRPAGGGPLVVYTKSGGVAGVYEHLVVARDGSAALEVGYRQPVRESFELEAAEFDRLSGLLAAADFGGVDPGPGIGCADCFQYEIEYGGKTIAFAEIGDIPQSVGEVVGELGRIVEANTPAAPASG
jgi:hypothetical protein